MADAVAREQDTQETYTTPKLKFYGTVADLTKGNQKGMKEQVGSDEPIK